MEFIKKNWFGIAMAAGFGVLGWLTYMGGKLDGNIEAYDDCHKMLSEAFEEIQKDIETE